MTSDEIQKDREAGTPGELAERLIRIKDGITHQADRDALSNAVNRLYALTAENAALKERVADDYFGSLVTSARDAAEKATVKFPQPNYVTLKIAEEAGEVVRGAVHYAEGRMEWSEVEGEIVQLLAMLIRFVTEGDQINGITPPRSIGEKP